MYRGQKPFLSWLCPLDVLQHDLHNPIYQRPGHFGYRPEFADDFSTIDFVQTPRYHLLQLQCGTNMTVICIDLNTDGTRTTKRKESHLVYMRCANGRLGAMTDLSTVHCIAALPVLDPDNKIYGGSDEKKYAELHLFHACFKKILAKFNVASEK
jgi:hypothetical protein